MVSVRRKDETITIENLDDLYRVVKEVRKDDEPLVLVIAGLEETISPAPRRRRRTAEERKKANEEAFWSSFGAWKGHIDPEEFKRQIREGRGHRADDEERDTSFRPTPEQIAAAMSAAGALEGLIDPERTKAEIKEARSSRRRLADL